MFFEVDFVDRRDCVSDAVYGGGGLLVEVRGDEVWVVCEGDDIATMVLEDRYWLLRRVILKGERLIHVRGCSMCSCALVSLLTLRCPSYTSQANALFLFHRMSLPAHSE